MSEDLLTKLAENVRGLFNRVGYLESLEDCCLTIESSSIQHTVTTAGAAAGSEDIDVQTVWGVPEGISAVLLIMTLRDSGSAGAGINTMWGQCSEKGEADVVRLAIGNRWVPAGITNSQWIRYLVTVPVDSNGEITCDWASSGVGTMDLYLYLAGYV